MDDTVLNMRALGVRCEKVPEEEFDAHPEWLTPGWIVLSRKGGFVYIGCCPNPGLQATAEEARDVDRGSSAAALEPQC